MCAQSVITQSADGQVAVAVDSLILVPTRGKTVVLPDARRHAGLPCTVKNTSTGSQTTIQGASGQTIDGAPAQKLTPALACVRCESDGANWWITARC